MPTKFVQAVTAKPAPEVMRLLECPKRTVYSWREGSRLPPEWVQKLVLARLRSAAVN